MKYRFLYIVLSLATLLAVSSCNSCSNDSKKNGGSEITKEENINPVVEELDDTPDEAITVTLVDYDADSIYVRADKARVNLSLSYQDARSSGNFKGTLVKGNTYSVFLENCSKRVVLAINVTELCSDKWFYDIRQFRGFSFNDKGGMTSINAEKICFREWKLLNGKLYIYYVDMQAVASDRHQYLVEEAELVTLDSKKLELVFLGTRYSCSKMPDKPLLLK